LIVKQSELYKIQNRFGFWGSTSDPAGELTTLPQTP